MELYQQHNDIKHIDDIDQCVIDWLHRDWTEALYVTIHEDKNVYFGISIDNLYKPKLSLYLYIKTTHTRYVIDADRIADYVKIDLSNPHKCRSTYDIVQLGELLQKHSNTIRSSVALQLYKYTQMLMADNRNDYGTYLITDDATQSILNHVESYYNNSTNMN